jgi:hypothetical protein
MHLTSGSLVCFFSLPLEWVGKEALRGPRASMIALVQNYAWRIQGGKRGGQGGGQEHIPSTDVGISP